MGKKKIEEVVTKTEEKQPVPEVKKRIVRKKRPGEESNVPVTPKELAKSPKELVKSPKESAGPVKEAAKAEKQVEPPAPTKRQRKKKLVETLTEEVKKTLTQQVKPVQKKSDTNEYRNIPKPFLEKGDGVSIVFSSDHLKISQFSKVKEEELRNWVYRESLDFDVEGIGLWIKEYSIKMVIKNRFNSDPINFSFIGETAYKIAKIFKMNVKGLVITINTIKGE